MNENYSRIWSIAKKMAEAVKDEGANDVFVAAMLISDNAAQQVPQKAQLAFADALQAQADLVRNRATGLVPRDMIN